MGEMGVSITGAFKINRHKEPTALEPQTINPTKAFFRICLSISKQILKS